MKTTFLYIWMIIILAVGYSCQSSSETASEENQAEQVTEQPEPEIGRFDDQIAAFEEEDKTNPPPENPILFVGSSSIRMWKTIRDDLAPYPVMNRGFGGSNMPELIHYADRIVFPYNPKAIFVYEGDNDIGSEAVSPDSMIATLKTFHSMVTNELPEAKIFFISIKPSIRRKNILDKCQKTNQLAAEYCDAYPELFFVDVATPMLNEDGTIRNDIFIEDSLHMNAKGYEIWTEVVRPYLE